MHKLVVFVYALCSILDIWLINFKAMAYYSVVKWSFVAVPHRGVCRWWPRMANAVSPNHCRWCRCRRVLAMRHDETETNQLLAKLDKFADAVACSRRHDMVRGLCPCHLLRTTVTSVRRAIHSVRSEHFCSARNSTFCRCIYRFYRCSRSSTSVRLVMLVVSSPMLLPLVARGRAMPVSPVAFALQTDSFRSICCDSSVDVADVRF